MGKEIYISVDVESDGPIPGPNSMLSFGAVAFSAAGDVISSFTANLESLPDAKPNDVTMAWWGKHPEAWNDCRKDTQDPEKAMREFVAWAEELPGTPVFVAYPAGYDFMFMYWYMIKFVGTSPFSFFALDIKTYAMAVLKRDFRKTTKDAFRRRWFDNRFKHTHKAIDDAMEQGLLFINMRREHMDGVGEYSA